MPPSHSGPLRFPLSGPLSSPRRRTEGRDVSGGDHQASPTHLQDPRLRALLGDVLVVKDGNGKVVSETLALDLADMSSPSSEFLGLGGSSPVLIGSMAVKNALKRLERI